VNQQNCTHTITRRTPSALADLLALAWLTLHRLGHGFEVGLVWIERAQQRRRLHELSDHMLRDIGVTRADAHAEAAKPFWRP